MEPGDRIYFLVDRFSEIAGTIVSHDDESGRVVVKCDDDDEIFYGFEDQTWPNEDGAKLIRNQLDGNSL